MGWVALLLVLGCEAPAATQAGERLGARARPNIVLVSLDTLRADRVGAYGYAAGRTPSLDRLAREGALFARAFTCIPRTTQALASLFTSRYPREHGAAEIGERLSDGATTLAEELARGGYATAGFSASHVASRAQGFDQGFQRFLDPASTEVTSIPGPGEPSLDAWMTRFALEWIDAPRRGPFFLWLHLMSPHFPYQPPPRFSPGLDASTFWFYHAADAPAFDRATVYYDLDGRSSAALPELSRLYDGEVSYADFLLGQVISRLRRGDLGPTLVVATADHGESLGEHGYYYEHGDLVYDETMRIPLLFSYPEEIPAGLRVEQPVSILDLYPTLLAAAGVEPRRAELRGADLGVAWRGAERGRGGESSLAPDRLLFGESDSALFPQSPVRRLGGRRSGGPGGAFRFLRAGDWVLVRRSPPAADALYDAAADPRLKSDVASLHDDVVARLAPLLAGVDPLAARWTSVRSARWKLVAMPGPERPGWALYDTASDPGESEDRSGSAPGVRRALERALREWMRSQARPAAAAQGRDEDLERNLRALGYLP